jgi:hypothetical protein
MKRVVVTESRFHNLGNSKQAKIVLYTMKILLNTTLPTYVENTFYYFLQLSKFFYSVKTVS